MVWNERQVGLPGGWQRDVIQGGQERQGNDGTHSLVVGDRRQVGFPGNRRTGMVKNRQGQNQAGRQIGNHSWKVSHNADPLAASRS